VVFDDVFVPRDRVFLYYEYEFAWPLVERFASYHRQSCACKSGVGGCSHRGHPYHCRVQRLGKGRPREGQYHRDEPLKRDLVLRFAGMRGRRPQGTERDLLRQHPAGQRVQAECHAVSVRDFQPGPGCRRRPDGDPAVPCRFRHRGGVFKESDFSGAVTLAFLYDFE